MPFLLWQKTANAIIGMAKIAVSVSVSDSDSVSVSESESVPVSESVRGSEPVPLRAFPSRLFLWRYQKAARIGFHVGSPAQIQVRNTLLSSLSKSGIIFFQSVPDPFSGRQYRGQYPRQWRFP